MRPVQIQTGGAANSTTTTAFTFCEALQKLGLRICIVIFTQVNAVALDDNV
jgi:hypothetical protein